MNPAFCQRAREQFRSNRSVMCHNSCARYSALVQHCDDLLTSVSVWIEAETSGGTFYPFPVKYSNMGLRSGVRSVINKIGQLIPTPATVDHPSDGGITGEDYPEDDSQNEQ